MDDLISRQAAIDELSQRYIIMDNPHYIGYNAGLDEAQKVIKALPTVQLGMSLAEVGTYVPDMNAGDMIYRQAVIDLLKQMRKDGDMVPWEGKNVFARIRKLPSVQPTITHEQAIDYLHKTGWLQNHDRILTESKIMMPAQPIIYCEKCLYKKICSWKNQGAKFCSFGERGDSE